MIKIIILSIALFFSACSFKSQPNQWQYKSTTAFESYTKNFLSENDALAKNDLSRAIKHAKQSADLNMLARINLGVCALNISVGIDDSCQDYLNLADVVQDSSLEAYYGFIIEKSKYSIENLNNQYRDFASYLRKKDFDNANTEMLKIDKVTSKLLAASIIKDSLSQVNRYEMIKVASFYGYKKSVLFWLNEAKINATNENERKKLLKKISVLKSES